MSYNVLTAEEVLRRAHAVGDYYGFVPFATLAAERKGLKKRIPSPEAVQLPALDPIAESVAQFIKQCRDAELISVEGPPLFVWHSNITPGRPAPKNAQIQFHAIGTDRSLADAVIIQAMRALAHDVTKEDPVVRINTLGDKETRARFARELGNFFKKRGTDLPEECLMCAKRDVFEAAELAIAREFGDELPSSTDFLSDQSRKRFEEIIEYLEATGTVYELASDLLSRGSAWSETCFAIAHDDRTLVWGSRYSELARLILKESIPATGAVLKIETSGAKVRSVRGRGSLRFAFVHIGEEAKRESMKLADELRHAKLPVWQVIGMESLTEQMRQVEKMNPPYLLIMGRKEALERSVVLRNRATQEDMSIPIGELTRKLERVR